MRFLGVKNVVHRDWDDDPDLYLSGGLFIFVLLVILFSVVLSYLS